MRAGGIDSAEALFPEAATAWEKWVVLNDGLAVFGPGRETRAVEMFGDLAGVLVEGRLDGADAGGVLSQQHLPRHGFHVRVGELGVDPIPVLELLGLRSCRPGRLP